MDEPADSSELLFAPDSNRLMLTLQRPLLRLVIQESFENLQASLLFNHAFPKSRLALHYIKDALIGAANTYRPGSEQIYQRLIYDNDYMLKLAPLVSHTNANDNSTETTHSRTRGFVLCEVRSKSVAAALSCQPSWELAPNRILCNSSRSSYQIITTRFPTCRM